MKHFLLFFLFFVQVACGADIFVPENHHNNKVYGLPAPVAGDEAATKAYVDANAGGGTGGLSNVPVGNTLYVDQVNGDNLTAVPGFLSSPYKTIPPAVAAATSGTVIYVGAGAFTLTTPLTFPANNITLYGAGAGYTTITGSSIKPRTGCVIADATFDNRTGSNASASFCIGLDTGDAAATDVTISGVRLLGNTDGFFFNKSGVDRITISDSTASTTLECLFVANTTGTITVNNFDFLADGVIGGASIAAGINQTGGTTISSNGTIKVINNATSNTAVNTTGATTRAELHNVQVTRTNPGFALVQAGGSTVAVENVSNTTGAALNTSGTITELSRYAVRDKNLSDLTSAATARTNLGLAIGTNVEAYLGNPSVDGYVLSSTISGTRSWIAGGTGGGTVDNSAFNPAWNGQTTVAPTLNNVYDYLHLLSPADNGKAGLLSQVAGIANTDASGVFQTPLTAPIGAIVGTTDTQTLTNKRITKRQLATVAPGPTPAVNTNNYDVVHFTGINAAITSMTTGLTGAASPGDTLRFDFTDDGSDRSITWGTGFEASPGQVLPTTTTAGVRMDVGFVYNQTTTKWRCLASSNASGVTGLPGGSDTQFQFNNASAFGGTANLVVSGGQVKAVDANFVLTNIIAPTAQASFSLANVSPGTTASIVLANAATLVIPKPDAGAANQFLTGIPASGVPTKAQPTEADLAMSNITTNNVSITQHGFAPILPNDATKFLNGIGGYTVPAGGAGGTPGGATTNVQYNSSSAFAGDSNFTWDLTNRILGIGGTGADGTVKTQTPAAIAGAQAGGNLTLAGSDAVAGSSTAGAATGGSISFTAGDAKRLSSGTAAGGSMIATLGAGIGGGLNGTFTMTNSGASNNVFKFYSGGTGSIGATIGLGTTISPPTEFTVGETGTTSPRGIMSWQSSTGTDGARFYGRKSRGTFGSPTTIVTGDTIRNDVGSAYDGTSFVESASVKSTSVGTIATTRVPSKLEFMTSTDATPSVLTTALTLDQSQNATFAGSILSPTLVTPALGTPASGTLTSCTGLPIGGITGLGTGVGTALAVNVGTSGAFVVNGGALGTPSSGSAANLTSFPTLNQNTTGSAATLTTARNLWGVSFNGSAAIGGAIELGTAGTTDCTLDRSGAGAMQIEGVVVPTISSTSTLTNKRINPRATGGCEETSSGTSTPDSDACDQWDVTALAATDAFVAPSGTPVNGQKLIIRIKDNGGAQLISFATGSSGAYRFSSDMAAPTTTVISKTMYLGFRYNAADLRWDNLAQMNNF